MRLNLALLALLFCVFAISSCSIEKRIYNSGYHITWNNFLTSRQGYSMNADTCISLRQAEPTLSQPLNLTASLNEASPLLSNLAIKPDTIVPKQEEDYIKNKPNDEKAHNITSGPIRRPKTVEELKTAIKRDFKMVLVATITGAISAGLLTLFAPASGSVGNGIIFLTLVFILSLFIFGYFFIRGIVRIFKLTALKISGKKDETPINKKERKHRVRESEHQYLRRFAMWFIQNLFSPIGRLKILGLLLLIAIPLLVIFNPH